MGSCYSAEVREISRRKKEIRRIRPIKIRVIPPTPEEKVRKREAETDTPVQGKNKSGAEMEDIGSTSDVVPSSRADQDRFASLRGQDVSALRRASHAGFASQRLVELARRPSMPAHLLMPDDSQRKLHTSSACVNLIQEFHSMKVVGKDGSEHYMDDQLQKILRQLKKTESTRVQPNSNEHQREEEVEVQRSASTEDLEKKEKVKGSAEIGCIRRTNSDTKVGSVDITDPEANET